MSTRTVRTYGRRPPSSPPTLVGSDGLTPQSLLFTPSPPSTPPKPILKRRATSEPPSPSPKKILADADLNRITAPAPPSLPPLPSSSNVKQGTLLGFITRKPATARPAKKPRPEEVPTRARPKTEQLVFTQGARQNCRQCNMSWMRGVDDAVHASHHSRITEGIPVTKAQLSAWTQVSNASLRKAKTGTVTIYITDYAGAKVVEACDAVDRVLSASTLPEDVRTTCKVFLCVIKSRIVGVVVSQPIKHAMAVTNEDKDGVQCAPERLPTPLGIHRVFTVPSYRGNGLAIAMLQAAAERTVYGRTFKPEKDEIAFSQPTEGGRRVMRRWGVKRVFSEDDQ